MEASLEGTVELLDGMAFTATAGSGHALTLDAAGEVGGRERGPRPMELILLGLGGCAAMDVVSILRKMRQDVAGYEVRLRGERAAEHPRVFTRIVVEHRVHGRGLSPAAVRRAVELSATKYCPVAAMLGRVAPIEERFRAVDDATGVATTGAIAVPAAGEPAATPG